MCPHHIKKVFIYLFMLLFQPIFVVFHCIPGTFLGIEKKRVNYRVHILPSVASSRMPYHFPTIFASFWSDYLCNIKIQGEENSTHCFYAEVILLGLWQQTKIFFFGCLFNCFNNKDGTIFFRKSFRNYTYC